MSVHKAYEPMIIPKYKRQATYTRSHQYNILSKFEPFAGFISSVLWTIVFFAYIMHIKIGLERNYIELLPLNCIHLYLQIAICDYGFCIKLLIKNFVHFFTVPTFLRVYHFDCNAFVLN